MHEHGSEEEIFYVLAGSGLSFQRGRTAPIAAGDCVVYLAHRGAHSVRADQAGLDLLAFGPREHAETLQLPRIGLSLINGRAIPSEPGSIDGVPTQFVRESELGPPEIPDEPGDRPSTIVNLADLEPVTVEHGAVLRTRRNLGRAAGSVSTGLQHVEVPAGRESTAKHCHSHEEEIFVVLGGSGVAEVGEDEIALREGSVLARPAGTGVAHLMRAGEEGLTYLAYGPRDPSDMCWYPRSQKVAFRGLGVIARVEPLGYWDGE